LTIQESLERWVPNIYGGKENLKLLIYKKT
jgi:hypothetical protein